MSNAPRLESMSNRMATKSTYLTAQLRESGPYLRDIGWCETAALLTLAADEIEQLRTRVLDLENAAAPKHERTSPRPGARLRRRSGQRV